MKKPRVFITFAFIIQFVYLLSFFFPTQGSVFILFKTPEQAKTFIDAPEMKYKDTVLTDRLYRLVSEMAHVQHNCTLLSALPSHMSHSATRRLFND